MLPDDVSKGSFINHVAQRGAQEGEIEDQNRNVELILITMGERGKTFLNKRATVSTSCPKKWLHGLCVNPKRSYSPQYRYSHTFRTQRGSEGSTNTRARKLGWTQSLKNSILN